VVTRGPIAESFTPPVRRLRATDRS